MPFADLPEDHELRRMLMTPREGHLFDDGTSFTHPRALKGVPLERITEEHEYWESSWKSLDDYMAGEQHQENEKRRYHDLYMARTGATPQEQVKHYKEKAKIHSDNVSKQRKIRAEFGSLYHPNQVVSKEYLPAEGLCDQEIAYKLACKISDLAILQKHGELAMDPFDFIRWRISLKMEQKDVWKRGASNNPVRSIISKLGDDAPIGVSKVHEDRLFREAILRSAKYQGTEKKYGIRKRRGSSHSDDTDHARPAGQRRQRRGKGVREIEAAPSGETAAELKARRRERLRARLQQAAAQNPTPYSGTARKGV